MRQSSMARHQGYRSAAEQPVDEIIERLCARQS